MELFWQEKCPLTSVDIIEKTKEKTWSGNYVHKMLRKLVKEEFVKVCGLVQYGRQYARQFEPLVSREDYMAALLKWQGITMRSFTKIAVAFLKGNESDAAEETETEEQEHLIEELESMIEQLKRQEEK